MAHHFGGPRRPVVALVALFVCGVLAGLTVGLPSRRPALLLAAAGAALVGICLVLALSGLAEGLWRRMRLLTRVLRDRRWKGPLRRLDPDGVPARHATRVTGRRRGRHAGRRTVRPGDRQTKGGT